MMSSWAIWLYGSSARGDADEESDIDVLVVGDVAALDQITVPISGERLSVSRYTWQEFDDMANYGSLFLHHLAAEGKPVSEALGGHGRIQTALQKLPAYQLADRDLRWLRIAVADARSAESVGSSPEFELSTLGGVVRNLAVLTCYLSSAPCFNRNEALAMMGEYYRLSRSETAMLEKAQNFRVGDERLLDTTRYAVQWGDVYVTCQIIESIISEVESRHVRTN